VGNARQAHLGQGWQVVHLSDSSKARLKLGFVGILTSRLEFT
jgi:hypothetical protein